MKFPNPYLNDFPDPYLDSNGVLKNLLGITDAKNLEKMEGEISFSKIYELRKNPIKGNFDLEHLQKIHKYLFGNVYAWAGEIRKVDVRKGETFFSKHMDIESKTSHLFNRLFKENYLQDLDAKEFSRKAAFYLGGINILHPFREGNGRTQRTFISQLAKNAAFGNIKWINVPKKKMVEASKVAYNGDVMALADLIYQNLDLSSIVKRRLLVMNGQKLTQVVSAGEWTTEKVEKAGPIRPNIYNLYNAKEPDKNKETNGVIIHTDKDFVFQFTASKEFIKHNLENFDSVPGLGESVSIVYKEGRAAASPFLSSQRLKRSR